MAAGDNAQQEIFTLIIVYCSNIHFFYSTELSFKGDFTSMYGKEDQANQWDCIVTCFFIDTAPVVVDYIDVIFSALRPGLFCVFVELLSSWNKN